MLLLIKRTQDSKHTKTLSKHQEATKYDSLKKVCLKEEIIRAHDFGEITNLAYYVTLKKNITLLIIKIPERISETCNCYYYLLILITV